MINNLMIAHRTGVKRKSLILQYSGCCSPFGNTALILARRAELHPPNLDQSSVEVQYTSLRPRSQGSLDNYQLGNIN